MRPASDPVKRFMEKVSIDSKGCYIWTAQIKRDGYGAFAFRGLTMKAHRAAHILFKGEIPEGQCVLHKCDVRACVNPEHLFIGTQDENVLDMDAKGRRGTRAKLSVDQQRKVRFWSAWVSQQKIAASFGIDQTTVSRVLRSTQASTN